MKDICAKCWNNNEHCPDKNRLPADLDCECESYKPKVLGGE